jgi:hypothetical protein
MRNSFLQPLLSNNFKNARDAFKHIYLIIIVDQCMNAFDKHKKGFTAWCEDCNEVFDMPWSANMHRDQKGHRIKITEFWITGRK